MKKSTIWRLSTQFRGLRGVPRIGRFLIRLDEEEDGGDNDSGGGCDGEHEERAVTVTSGIIDDGVGQ